LDRLVPVETTSRGTVPEPNAATADNTPTATVDPSRARITLLLASLGFFLITLDILIVNVALAQIGRELGGGTVGQQWVVDGYTVCSPRCCCSPATSPTGLGRSVLSASVWRCSG
jgi:hypothetical protein